ncbi:uncharacterized protein LOC125545493 [Triticum urartu]|uniref:uncharacterized protein LOC125545493 n=1 Tax=Triticum urartu TaxID=4572 RepID=UPI0020441FD5|nr:uncharacterized protein LOC125545493 [Triticum urartu]
MRQVLAAMDEGNSNITKMLESLLAKMDEQKAVHDKQIEIQAAFNAQISQDVRGLSRQIDLTQADVDATRKTVEGSASPSGSITTVLHQPAAPQQPPPPPPPPPHTPRVATEQGCLATAHARLGGHRPPLIPVPPQGRFATPVVAPSPTAGHYGNDYHKPPKHDFPRFDGSAPYLWLDHCLAYFELYKVAPQNWVATVALYIEGQAAHWLQAFRQTHRGITWEVFTFVVLEEFGADEFEVVMHKLLQLRQTATVAEYRAAFDEQMYHLLALDPSINTKFFVTQFVLGLKDELRAPVRLQAPSSITRASVLACIQEEELGTTRVRPRITPAGRPPPAAAPPQPRAAAPNRAPTDDYARERQLRDYRRANNLCFKCGDRYSREHRCAQPAQLLTISVGDHGRCSLTTPSTRCNSSTTPDRSRSRQLLLGMLPSAASSRRTLWTARTRRRRSACAHWWAIRSCYFSLIRAARTASSTDPSSIVSGWRQKKCRGWTCASPTVTVSPATASSPSSSGGCRGIRSPHRCASWTLARTMAFWAWTGLPNTAP